MDFQRNRVWRRQMDSCNSEYGSMAGSCSTKSRGYE
jgi:hypothetical protein